MRKKLIRMTSLMLSCIILAGCGRSAAPESPGDAGAAAPEGTAREETASPAGTVSEEGSEADSLQEEDSPKEEDSSAEEPVAGDEVVISADDLPDAGNIRALARPLLTGGAVTPEEEPPEFHAEDPGIPENLEELENWEDFCYLDERSQELLLTNGFFVSEGGGHEFFEEYEMNRYELTPNFVTADSLLHSYHLFFSQLLKKTEKEHLIYDLEALTEGMLDASLDQYDELKGTEWESAAARNSAYFAVALTLLDNGSSLSGAASKELPDTAAALAGEEIRLIMAAEGLAVSPLFEDYEDYSQYKPRGYYDQDEDLSCYFRALMWYGRMNFTQINEDLDRSALLMLLAMDGDNLSLWERIYTVTSFFAGQSDDAGYYEYRPIADAVYGSGAQAGDLAGDEASWKKYHTLTGKVPAPEINSIPIFDESIDEDRDAVITGFRFMGQRSTADAVIFQNLIYRSVKENEGGERRMLPDALDVAAAMGSDEALEILDSQGETGYAGYTEKMELLKEKIEEQDDSFWSQSLYNSWLNMIRPLLAEKEEGYPAFMRTKAWLHKNLSTFLGSWTELKHDTILYGKQVMAEMGGGWDEDRDDRGYVEPEPLVYARLCALAEATAEGLESFDYLSKADGDNLEILAEMAERLQVISEKELAGELPSDEEFELIRTWGGQLEHFWYEAIRDQAASEYVRAQEFPSALVVDVATDPSAGLVLETATGKPSTVYVIVTVDGVRKLATGTVFSFYQFTQPIGDRMTDTQWREKMGIDWTEEFWKNPDPVPAPEWTSDYFLANEW